jgi:hypothetical protein
MQMTGQDVEDGKRIATAPRWKRSSFKEEAVGGSSVTDPYMTYYKLFL